LVGLILKSKKKNFYSTTNFEVEHLENYLVGTRKIELFISEKNDNTQEERMDIVRNKLEVLRNRKANDPNKINWSEVFQVAISPFLIQGHLASSYNAFFCPLLTIL
jgi:cell fate regulator YaaT (PSP1 superfamily)